MSADLGHLADRVPDGQGHPAEFDRRHQAKVTGQHLQIAAQLVVDSIAGGDLGAARRYLHDLQHDPARPVDPWRLVEDVATLALRRAAATADASG